MRPVIPTEVPRTDHCPLFSAIRAALVPQGVAAVIEHVVRDGTGRPVDLAPLFAVSQPDPDDRYFVRVRIKEAVSPFADPTTNPFWELPATVEDVFEGRVRIPLLPALVEYAGIYEAAVAVVDANRQPVLVDRFVVWVEKSLWSDNLDANLTPGGPPTLQEIRTLLMDRDPADNSLLDRVEFSTDQVVTAICQPVRLFNEMPPPVAIYDTRTFPFQAAWRDAIVGHLLVMAAHNYRRNHLPYSAGGVSVDDKNKEGPYLSMGLRLLDEYKTFVINKKVEINAHRFVGGIGSPFGRGWR